MILGAALATPALAVGRIIVVIFLAVTIALAGWLTGQLIAGDVNTGSLHPGYYRPTAAGGLVGAGAAAQVHLGVLAEASFGIGIFGWLLISSLMLNRIFVRPVLPPPLVPTLAIELAPPTVGGVAYFVLNGGKIDFFAAALAGCAALMAVAQLRFVSLYTRLRFSLSFWSFTFAYAAAATDGLLWLTRTRPPGTAVYAVVVLVLITVLITGIAIGTVVVLARGRFLAPPD
jgi:tellurite resistance protein